LDGSRTNWQPSWYGSDCTTRTDKYHYASGGLTNSQADLTFFNPNTSPQFSSFLAEHHA
jgi:hypothetical protein